MQHQRRHILCCLGQRWGLRVHAGPDSCGSGEYHALARYSLHIKHSSLLQSCGCVVASSQVNKYDDCQQGAIALVCEAYRLWLQYETRTDDITAAIIRFDVLDRNHTEPGVK